MSKFKIPAATPSHSRGGFLLPCCDDGVPTFTQLQPRSGGGTSHQLFVNMWSGAAAVVEVWGSLGRSPSPPSILVTRWAHLHHHPQ